MGFSINLITFLVSSKMLSTLVAIISAAGALAQSAADTAILDAPRTTDVLASQYPLNLAYQSDLRDVPDITAMYPFPTTNTSATFNISNVQGDIL